MAMDPTLGTYQRIYLQIRRGAAGRLQFVASMKRPMTGALVALISQGSIARDGMVLDIVSDPSQDPTLTGPAGPKGDTGASGPQGPKGDVGATGATGPSGPAGPAGAKGDPGAKGDTGASGSAGATGATGPKGDVGPKGDTGAQGPAGSKGDQGAIGPQGSTGAKGDTGPAGATGQTGATGATGPKGDTGATGPAGPSTIGAPTARTITTATAYQATDKTKPAVVTINVASTAALTITGGQTHTAELLIGPTAASVTGTATGGTAVARYSNSNTGALTVGLAISTIDGKPITAHLPAGWYFALRIVSGTVQVVSAFDQAVG